MCDYAIFNVICNVALEKQQGSIFKMLVQRFTDFMLWRLDSVQI